jgi:DNA-binding response OmpR family regulator
MSVRVLLVEDEPDLAFTVRTRLELTGMDVATVGSGEDALELVARDRPDVLVLDLRLPGIDGLEVLRQVKETDPALPVVILSAHSSIGRLQLAARMGSAAYLVKPVDLRELERTLRAVVGA